MNSVDQEGESESLETHVESFVWSLEDFKQMDEDTIVEKAKLFLLENIQAAKNKDLDLYLSHIPNEQFQ